MAVDGATIQHPHRRPTLLPEFVNMPQAPLSSLVSSFLLGVTASVATSFVVRWYILASKDITSTRRCTSNTRKAQESDLLDSPDLDLRLIRKAEAVIRQRSGNLTVVIERATNMFNHSACLRTAEALGIHNVWIVDPQACNDEYSIEENGEGNVIRDTRNKLLKLTTEEAEERRQHHLFARNATEWLSIREFQTTAECVQALRKDGYQIYVTDLSQQAVELSPEDLSRHGNWPLPEKLAIVFGTEAVGCSAEMLNAADLRVYLPLRGFADSLNLSVATALVVHHLLLLQPNYVASMTGDERQDLRKLWFPKLARQRLLSSKDKKKRRKLKADISRMETTKAQQERGTSMNAQQLQKIAKLDSCRKELFELEERGQFGSSDEIVQELIENPPEPLSDLRRADCHRITFAGRNIKKNHADHWSGLAAVTNVHSENLSSAGYFREKLATVVPVAAQEEGEGQ